MNKKIFTVFFVIFLVITVVGLIALIINKNTSIPENNSEVFTQGIKIKMLKSSKGDTLSPRIETILKNLDNPQLDDEKKYQELQKLSFYFASEYATTHEPSLRIFVITTMNDFAKSNFPKYYKAYDFNFPCTDPSCGNEIDNKANVIIDTISGNKGVDQFYTNIILKNLKNALYLPDEEIEEKKSLLNLVITQLQELNNQEASKSAENLKKYYQDRYKSEL